MQAMRLRLTAKRVKLPSYSVARRAACCSTQRRSCSSTRSRRRCRVSICVVNKCVSDVSRSRAVCSSRWLVSLTASTDARSGELLPDVLVAERSAGWKGSSAETGCRTNWFWLPTAMDAAVKRVLKRGSRSANRSGVGCRRSIVRRPVRSSRVVVQASRLRTAAGSRRAGTPQTLAGQLLYVP